MKADWTEEITKQLAYIFQHMPRYALIPSLYSEEYLFCIFTSGDTSNTFQRLDQTLSSAIFSLCGLDECTCMCVISKYSRKRRSSLNHHEETQCAACHQLMDSSSFSKSIHHFIVMLARRALDNWDERRALSEIRHADQPTLGKEKRMTSHPPSRRNVGVATRSINSL